MAANPPDRLSDVLAGVARAKIAARWEWFSPECDERRRRLWTAAEASAYGPGGVALLASVTGVSEDTIRRGQRELESGERLEEVGQVRRPGGGRRAVVDEDPGLLDDLDRLIDPATRGDPESVLRWTSKSLSKLCVALSGMGHEISESTLGKILKALGYRLQANHKTLEGNQHPDRDAQFQHISRTVTQVLAAGEPAISIDTSCRRRHEQSDADLAVMPTLIGIAGG